jgi:L-fuconolactonase
MPDVRFVVDHLAKPSIRAGEDRPWRHGVAAFAGLPNAWWKLSGLVTEADWQAWRPADLQPYLDRVLTMAGPDRLLFGSDWPVCLMAAQYDRVLETARTLISALTVSEQAAVLGRTASAVYGLALDPALDAAPRR